MPSTISNKRQREDSRDTATARAATVQRDPKEIRHSIRSLHEKPHLSDLTVSVQLSNEHEAQDFRCISAVLASASRVLETMLFGPMADASLLDQPRHLRILRLRGTEPWCFEQMLSFIHGQHISLTMDTAVQLHEIADYYEVLPLRDASCRFLLEALRPHNCCGLLMRSYAINCEPLTQRCLDTLTLDFVAVVDSDPGFAELGAAVLRSIIARDSLVCAKEREVFEALLKWYAVRPAEKHAALLEMLPLVRWAFVLDERPGVLEPALVEDTEARRKKLLAGLRTAVADAYRTGGEASASGMRKTISSKSKPAAELAAEPAVERSASFSSANVQQQSFVSCSAAEEEEAEEEEEEEGETCTFDMRKKQKTVAYRSLADAVASAPHQEPVYRSLGCEAEVHAGSPSCAATAAESALAELEASVEQCLAQQLPVQQGKAAEQLAACRPRHYTWGTLVGRNPEPPSSQPFTPDMQTWRLESRQEYVIGRSRKSTIRIGHDAPMPYISSHHFRVYNKIEWAAGSCPSSQDSSQSASQDETQDASQGALGGAPRLEAWLEDLSQNGTFVNGTLVGRNEKRKLKDGDRIELVFPQESSDRSSNNVNHFPTFTYQAPSPPGDLSLAGGVQCADAAPSPDGAASQSSSQEITNAPGP